MNPLHILYPILAMVVLTLVVARVLYLVRKNTLIAKQIRPREIALSGDLARVVTDTRASDNFRNLFEVPVLFYVWCVVVYVTQSVTWYFVVGAWLFVALRYAHSYVQCTSNRIKHRFMAFAASIILMGVLWCAWFVLQLVK